MDLIGLQHQGRGMINKAGISHKSICHGHSARNWPVISLPGSTDSCKEASADGKARWVNLHVSGDADLACPTALLDASVSRCTLPALGSQEKGLAAACLLEACNCDAFH